MKDREEAHVRIDGASIHVDGEDGEVVNIGPGGIHVRDANSEVHVSWTGVRVRDGRTNLSISLWKPLAGCAVALVVLVAVLTAVVMGIVKLML